MYLSTSTYLTVSTLFLLTLPSHYQCNVEYYPTKERDKAQVVYWERKPYIWKEHNKIQGIIPMIFYKAKVFCSQSEQKGGIESYNVRADNFTELLQLIYDPAHKESSAIAGTTVTKEYNTSIHNTTTGKQSKNQKNNNSSRFINEKLKKIISPELAFYGPFMIEHSHVNETLLQQNHLRLHSIASVKHLSVLIHQNRLSILSKLYDGIQNVKLIFFVTALCATFFGFLIWALEGMHNEEFGTFVHMGIWWSQVTMTTTGYGDTVPKTILGKLLASVTMTVGILLLALSTAAVIDVITGVKYLEIKEEDTVAVVRHTYEHLTAERDLHATTVLCNSYIDVYEAVRANKSLVGLVNSDIALWDSKILSNWKIETVYNIAVDFPISCLVSTEEQSDKDKFLKCVFDEYKTEIIDWTEKYFRKPLRSKTVHMPTISQAIESYLAVQVLTWIAGLFGTFCIIHDSYKKIKLWRENKTIENNAK